MILVIAGIIVVAMLIIIPKVAPPAVNRRWVIPIRVKTNLSNIQRLLNIIKNALQSLHWDEERAPLSVVPPTFADNSDKSSASQRPANEDQSPRTMSI
jgi:hypothetical protein